MCYGNNNKYGNNKQQPLLLFLAIPILPILAIITSININVIISGFTESL